MKKMNLILSGSLLVMSLGVLSPAVVYAGAETETAQEDENGEMSWVFDDCGILSDDEITELNDELATIYDTYGYDAVLWISQDVGEDEDYRQYAAEFMQANEIGYGDTHEGMCIFHQPDHAVAQIPLQMLLAVFGMSGFRPGINAVENILLYAGIIAAFLIGFIPVGIFNDKIAFGIYFFCRTDHFFRKIRHLLQTEVRPGPLSLFFDAVLTAAGGKEEIIQYDLIEFRSRISDNFEKFIPVSRVGKAEGIENTRFVVVR